MSNQQIIEEIDIIVRAKVEEARKDIKKMVNDISNEMKKLGNIDQFNNMKAQISQVASTAEKSFRNVKININGKEFSKMTDNLINEVREKLDSLELNFGNLNLQEIDDQLKAIDEMGIDFAPDDIIDKYNLLVDKSNELKDTLENINPKIDTNDNYYDIEKAKENFKDLGDETEKIDKKTSKLRGTIRGIIDEIKYTKSVANGLFKHGNNFDNIFTKKIQSGIKSIRKFALSLLGIRTAFTAVTRAANAYLSFDKELSDSIQNNWNALGSLLAPILEYIVDLFSKLTSVIATFVKTLTGVDLIARANAKALNNQANATKNVASATKGLSSIDDIDTLSSGSGSSAGGTDFKPITAQELNLPIFDNILKRIKDIQNAWNKGDWKNVGKLIGQSFTDVFNFLDEKIKEIDWEVAGKNFSDALTGVDWGAVGSSIINLIWDGMAAAGTFVLSIDWGDVATSLSNAIIEWANTIKRKFDETDWKTVGKTIADDVCDFLENFDWIKVGQSITKSIVTGMTSIDELIHSMIKEFINRLLKKVGLDDEGTRKTGVNIVMGIYEGLMKTIVHLLFPFTYFIDLFKKMLGIHSPSTLFAEFGVNLIQGFINGINSMINKVVNTFSDLWSKIKTKTSESWNSIWSTIKGFLNSGIGGFESMINGIIRGFNSLKSSINKISIDIPDWVPGGLGGKKLGFNLQSTSEVKLPRLKDGDVAYEPTNAIIAEYPNARQNPEIVSPVSMMKQSFRDVLSEFDLGGNRFDKLCVNVAGKNFFDDVIDYIRDKITRNGVTIWEE